MKNFKSSAHEILLSLLFLFGSSTVFSIVPRPDHVVIVVFENHAYQQVIGSSAAPYINHLASIGANMAEFYALTHPSQPNYIMLFSGSNQGETTDNLPVGTPWSTPNLGASLLDSGFTFAGYSEDLPAIGSLVATSGAYARKHSPWTHWQGTGVNQIPASCNTTLDNFPTDFNQLPDLSFVIPNLTNDMHDGVDPTRIRLGDDFLYAYLSGYQTWAMNNNSLLIITFDEDENFSANHIPCIFVGPMVVPGQYSVNGYHHYDMLKTLEDMFNLPYAGNSATSTTIDEVWLTSSSASPINSGNASSVFPNPVTDLSNITFENKIGFNGQAKLQIYDVLGNLHSEEIYEVKSDTRTVPLSQRNLSAGIYFYRVLNSQTALTTGKFIVQK